MPNRGDQYPGIAIRRKTVAPDLRVRRIAPLSSQTPDSEVRRYWNLASEDFCGGLIGLACSGQRI